MVSYFFILFTFLKKLSFLYLNTQCDVFVLGRNQPSPQAGLAGPGPVGYAAARPVGNTWPGSEEVFLLRSSLQLICLITLEEIGGNLPGFSFSTLK